MENGSEAAMEEEREYIGPFGRKGCRVDGAEKEPMRFQLQVIF